MSEFKSVYEKFESLSQEERIAAAKGATLDVLNYLNEKNYNDEFKSAFFVILIGALIGVDGTVTNSEVDIFNAVFATEFTAKDLVKTISQLSTKENMEVLDRIIDAMPEKVKLSACVLALTVISADGDVGDDEAALFQKILF